MNSRAMTKRGWRRALVVLLLTLGALVACITSPSSGGTVRRRSGNVTFTGFYPHEGRRVTITLRVQRGTTFEPIGPTVEVADDGRWTIADVPVPDEYWTGFCRSAVFEAISSDGASSLFAQDRSCLDAAGPGVTLAEAAACLTNRVVLSRHASNATYAPPGGELRISSQADAELYRCVGTLDGNLTLVGESRRVPRTEFYAPGLTLTLWNLREVTGRLTVDGGRSERIVLPQLTRAGTRGRPETGVSFTANAVQTGAEPSAGFVTRLDLPRLTHVDGTLAMQSANPDGLQRDGSTYDLWLDGVASAENVQLRTGWQHHLRGLAGLGAVSRDVSIDYNFEMGDTSLLSSLRDIGGSLTLRPNAQIERILRALVRVGEDVIFEKLPGRLCAVSLTPGQEPLRALGTIGRDLVLRGCSARCRSSETSPILPALASLGGTLRLTNEFDSSGANVGLTGLRLRGLDLQTTLTHHIPLHDDAVIEPTGSVVIDANSNLCQCHAEAFVERLRVRGFTGSARATGNAACAPCPARPACP